MGLSDLCGEWLVDLLNMLCAGRAVPLMKSCTSRSRCTLQRCDFCTSAWPAKASCYARNGVRQFQDLCDSDQRFSRRAMSAVTTDLFSEDLQCCRLVNQRLN